MPPPPKVWIVDDDAAVRMAFEMTVAAAGLAVRSFAEGAAMLEVLETEEPGLIVLDVDMPGMDGWQALERIRRRGFKLPVLMLTNVNDVPSRVRGLEGGADDYVGKPCGPAELVARVRALLRRTAPAGGESGQVWRLGDVTIDFERKKAMKGASELNLTRTDYALLALLREHAGRPVAHELILERVWGGRAGNAHALDTHIWRLRKKLGAAPNGEPWIRNLSGIGYLLDEGQVA